jgi:hypothetical protein
MKSPVFHLSIAAALCASAAFAQPPSPPQSAEMKKLLDSLSGTWRITSESLAGEGAPGGGRSQGKEVFRAGPGGRSLIEEYHSKDASGEVSGLGTVWWDEKARGYRALWCSNRIPSGCVVMARLANWEGDRFVLGDEWESGGRRISFKEVFSDINPASYTQTLFQGETGTELKAILVIRARRE